MELEVLHVLIKTLISMTGRKMCALQVPSVVPYKALEKFSKALYGTTESTYTARARDFRPVMRQFKTQ